MAEQTELPGVEQEKIPALERAAKKYDGLKQPFAEARNALTSAKETLIKMMHQKVEPDETGVLLYKRGDVKVVIKPAAEKLKVVIGEDDDDVEVSTDSDDVEDEDDSENGDDEEEE